MLEATIGYGFLPLRALWWIPGLRDVGHGVCSAGAISMRAVTAPTDQAAYESFMQNGTTPPHYPHFNAFVYSLENFCRWSISTRGCIGGPILLTTLRVMCIPKAKTSRHFGAFLHWYLWIHILAGWILTPLLAAGLSGLIHM